MSVAETLAPVLRRVLGGESPVAVIGWDGSRIGPADAALQLSIKNRRALRQLLWAPGELGVARAYVAGDLGVDGDLLSGLDAIQQVALGPDGTGLRRDAETTKAIVAAVARLGAVGPPPRPPAEERPRVRGLRHSKARDASAISHHYDVGNDFYRLVLGESMTYSCAYWAAADYDIDRAQFAKCDLVARKLGITENSRVLDVGCGWGTFVLHAARTYGARCVGVTLSHEQAAYATQRMRDEGVADLVEIRVQDYRDIDDGPYDAIASIGMAEHVGAAMLATYARCLYRLLRPQGRLLNHAIARRPRKQLSTGPFIDRYVFPDGELEPIAMMVAAIEGAGFEVRDVESLREHYGKTLRAWVANLEARWDEALALVSPGRARVWRLYMAASALAFEANRIGVNQVLAVKPGERGRSGMPPTRRRMLGRDSTQP